MSVSCCRYDVKDECLCYSCENYITILNLVSHSPLIHFDCGSSVKIIEFSSDAQVLAYVLSENPNTVNINAINDPDFSCLL